MHGLFALLKPEGLLRIPVSRSLSLRALLLIAIVLSTVPIRLHRCIDFEACC